MIQNDSLVRQLGLSRLFRIQRTSRIDILPKKSSNQLIQTDSLLSPFHQLLTVKMAGTSNHAIVFGASGIIGWSIVDQLLRSYPGVGSFSKITAVTNRPLDVSESFWPEASPERPDLQLVSGIDLRQGDGNMLGDSLNTAVKDIDTVTHIYYLGISPLRSPGICIETY